jgi:hypothetical protein
MKVAKDYQQQGKETPLWNLPLRLEWTLYLLLLSLRKMSMMKFLWHLVIRRGCSY